MDLNVIDVRPRNRPVDRLTLESSWVVTTGPSRVDRLSISLTRSSAVAVIADRTVRLPEKSLGLGLLRDFCFKAIHYDCRVSTCEKNVSTGAVTRAKPGRPAQSRAFINDWRTIKPVSASSYYICIRLVRKNWFFRVEFMNAPTLTCDEQSWRCWSYEVFNSK